MKEICFIAPYVQLYHMVQDLIASEERYSNVTVVLGDLEEGVEQAYRALESGTDILISRGGTYTMIHEQVKDANIYELKISAMDIMNSLKHVLNRSEEIAIIGYYNIIYGYDILSELKGIQLRSISINDLEPVEEKIRTCAAEGIKSFIGDTIVNRECRKLGYECYMIESSIDSVKMIIEQAQESLSYSKELLEQNRRYRALMDNVHEGVIATDETGAVRACNKVAEEILGISKERAIGKTLDELEYGESILAAVKDKKLIVDEIREIGQFKVTFSNIPIFIRGNYTGSIVAFQDIKKLQTYETKIRSQLFQKGFQARYTFDSIIHQSSIMSRCIEIAQKYSQYDSSVLIEGESGVGKELFAQSIHNAGARKNKPFVAVNCAALPKSLIESELFGYTEGAFTGARKGGKEGMFELAHRGTIFLDEIGELPLDVQGQLLRVLQEREVIRIGDSKVTPLNIRIICATNKNLNQMVRDGAFRQDLLYRINTLRLTIPRLNERREDVRLLAETFLNHFAEKYSKDVCRFSPAALRYLSQYDFIGNVRELRGIIERAVILTETRTITENELNLDLNRPENRLETTSSASELCQQEPLSLSLKELEAQYIQRIWTQEHQSITNTCRILKINRSTLWRKLKENSKAL